MQHGLPATHPQDLECLLNRVQELEYPYIDTFCSQIDDCVDLLQQEAKVSQHYTSLCAALSQQLRRYMRLRRIVIIPYLRDLQAKEEDGHDCRDCGGGCSIRHKTFIDRIRTAHQEIRELLEVLHMCRPSFFNVPDYPETLRTLRTNILHLEDAWSGIVFVEETSLIPIIQDLQRKIGAHD